jgi:hypothetical protein
MAALTFFRLLALVAAMASLSYAFPVSSMAVDIMSTVSTCQSDDRRMNVRKVVLVGVAHSGASQLLQALSLLDTGAFVFPEPYASWEQDVYEVEDAPIAQHNDGAGRSKPSLNDLLNCDGFDSDQQAMDLFSTYTCLQVPAIRRDATLFQECLGRKLSAKTLRSMCLSSSTRIVMLQRLPSAVVSHTGDKASSDSLDADIKVVHMLRNVESIIRSHLVFDAATDDGPSHPYPALGRKVSDMCSSISHNIDQTDALPKNQLIATSYEALSDDFTSTISLLICELDLSITLAGINRLADFGASWFNNSRDPEYEIRNIYEGEDDIVKNVLMSIESCGFIHHLMPINHATPPPPQELQE